MKPGETGHIEGRTGGSGLQKALDLLELYINDRIIFLRRLPPMEYLTYIETDNQRIKIPEGIAAKILGRSGSQTLQFCSAPTGQPFHVTDILGGKNAHRATSGYGIEPGKILIPEKVGAGRNLYMSNKKTRFVISTSEGLRLFIEPYQAGKILVSEITAHSES